MENAREATCCRLAEHVALASERLAGTLAAIRRVSDVHSRIERLREREMGCLYRIAMFLRYGDANHGEQSFQLGLICLCKEATWKVRHDGEHETGLAWLLLVFEPFCPWVAPSLLRTQKVTCSYSTSTSTSLLTLSFPQHHPESASNKAASLWQRIQLGKPSSAPLMITSVHNSFSREFLLATTRQAPPTFLPHIRHLAEPSNIRYGAATTRPVHRR